MCRIISFFFVFSFHATIMLFLFPSEQFTTSFVLRQRFESTRFRVSLFLFIGTHINLHTYYTRAYTLYRLVHTHIHNYIYIIIRMCVFSVGRVKILSTLGKTNKGFVSSQVFFYFIFFRHTPSWLEKYYVDFSKQPIHYYVRNNRTTCALTHLCVCVRARVCACMVRLTSTSKHYCHDTSDIVIHHGRPTSFSATDRHRPLSGA